MLTENAPTVISMFNTNQQQCYQTDGILILRSLFSPTELALIQQAAQRVKTRAQSLLLPGTRYWPGSIGYNEAKSRDRRGQATWGVDEIERSELFEPTLLDLFGHPAIVGAIHSLLGAGARVWRTSLLWSPQIQPYNLHWHRDSIRSARLDGNPDHVQINIALLPDACLRVLPGSHRRSLSAIEQSSVGTTKADEQLGAWVVNLLPGDIALINGNLLHRGTCDVGIERLTLHFSAQAAGVPLPLRRSQQHLDWICSEEFIGQLAIATQGFYRNLRQALSNSPPHSTIHDYSCSKI